MEKYLIYIEYSSFEYTNYFTLINHDTKIAEKYPVEKTGELFQMILEKNSVFELYIVKENDASDWDYEKELQDNQIKTLEQYSENKFSVTDIENLFGKTMCSLLFSGKCCLNGCSASPPPPAKKSEKITGFASVIKEKYERMKDNYG